MNVLIKTQNKFNIPKYHKKILIEQWNKFIPTHTHICPYLIILPYKFFSVSRLVIALGSVSSICLTQRLCTQHHLGDRY